jgi:thiamine biosynthesis lipoprotein
VVAAIVTVTMVTQLAAPAGSRSSALWTVDRALGTDVRVVVTGSSRIAAAKSAVDTVLGDIDATCSRFRDDSELSRLNAARGREVRVSPLLALAIGHGLRAAAVTGGAVDPTVGRALRVAGYDADFAAVAATGGPLVLTAHAVPGWQAVRFDAASRAVMIPAGVEIDLGATAKALAADLAAAAALRELDGGGVLVSLGGDIALAGEAPQGGWIVGVSDDSGDSTNLRPGRIALRTGAVASSSTRVRRWTRGEVEMHHIIDPSTGLPADSGVRLATVVASSCVDANIASTAAIVRGDGVVAWLESLALPARLEHDDGSVSLVAGFPASAEESPRSLRSGDSSMGASGNPTGDAP